jgi:hypothetical protein
MRNDSAVARTAYHRANAGRSETTQLTNCATDKLRELQTARRPKRRGRKRREITNSAKSLTAHNH